MIPNQIGHQVNIEWLKTLELRPDMNLMLGDFQVMPNHFHGIIIIGENKYNSRNKKFDTDAMHRVSTDDLPHRDLTNKPANPKSNIIEITNPKFPDSRTGKTIQNKFGPQKKNLGSIMRGFKSAVTTYARINNLSFKWQPKFHDHVIRNQGEYDRISNYIKKNPENWTGDKFF